MKYHFMPIRVAITKKKMGPKSVGKDEEKLEPLYIADGNVMWYSQCGKQFSGS